jgi:hypothetical protein
MFIEKRSSVVNGVLYRLNLCTSESASYTLVNFAVSSFFLQQAVNSALNGPQRQSF